MKRYLLLIFTIWVSICFSKDVIKLKNNFRIESKIINTASWGLKLENGQSVIFKVIAYIETTDSSVVNRIRLLYPDLSYSIIEDNTYKFLCSDYYFKPYSPKAPSIIDDNTDIFISLNYSPNLNTGFQFDLNSSFQLLFMRFGMSYSRFNRDLERNYNIFGINIGGGMNYKFNQDNLIALIFLYGPRIVEKDYDTMDTEKNRIVSVAFFELQYTKFNLIGRLSATIGIQSVIQQIPFDDYDNSTQIVVGFGLNYKSR